MILQRLGLRVGTVVGESNESVRVGESSSWFQHYLESKRLAAVLTLLTFQSGLAGVAQVSQNATRAVEAHSPSAAVAPIHIVADLTDAARKLYHAEIDIQVVPGHSIALISPQWIPGHHTGNGKAALVAGVVLTGTNSAGRSEKLAWKRDPVNLYELHVDVPRDVSMLHAHLDAAVSYSASRRLACSEWDRLMLYPAERAVASIPISPSVTVPAGWGVATALQEVGRGTPPETTGVNEEAHRPPANAVTIHYASTSVEQLEDSPVFTGKFFHEYALAPTISPSHFIDVFSDFSEDVNLSPSILQKLSNLVREASAAYGSHHYGSYHFLLTLSDNSGGEGLEHSQSSDDGLWEKGLSDDVQILGGADILAHEFTHSWNGKFRRPVLLWQPDFATPQQGQLLWVYEGLTQYMGNVLAARSGFRTESQYCDMLAILAATLENETGRQWRSTEDTAIEAPIGHFPPLWANWLRGWAFYQEGELLWLDIDTLIREKTGGQKSLTDFLHIFLGKGGDTGPITVTYDRAELIHDLNEVLQYDWTDFFRKHVDLPSDHTDLDGITRAGYQLAYSNDPTQTEILLSTPHGRQTGYIDVWYSLGIRLTNEGTVTDVKYGGMADAAGVAQGAKIAEVDGHPFSAEVLRTVLSKSRQSSEPISLLLTDGVERWAVSLAYHDGPRYPRLVRVTGSPDLLHEILRPLTEPQSTK